MHLKSNDIINFYSFNSFHLLINFFSHQKVLMLYQGHLQFLSTNDGSVNQRLRYYSVLSHLTANPILGVGLEIEI